jgi:hypothetical protein
MTWAPINYRRFEMSHPFFCVLEDDTASQGVQKVRDITSFLLHARRSSRGLLGSTEGSRYLILYSVHKKVTLPPRKYRRFEMSHRFCCEQEDDVAYQEVQNLRDITSFPLRAIR